MEPTIPSGSSTAGPADILPHGAQGHLYGFLVRRGAGAEALICMVLALLIGSTSTVRFFGAGDLTGALTCIGSIGGLLVGALLGAVLGLIIAFGLSRSLPKVFRSEVTPGRPAVTAASIVHVPFLLVLLFVVFAPSSAFDDFTKTALWFAALALSWAAFIWIGMSALESVTGWQPPTPEPSAHEV